MCRSLFGSAAKLVSIGNTTFFDSRVDDYMAMVRMRRIMRGRLDFLFGPRRAAMQELRTVGNWRHILKRLYRIQRLRKIWAQLGIYLRQYKALK